MNGILGLLNGSGITLILLAKAEAKYDFSLDSSKQLSL